MANYAIQQIIKTSEEWAAYDASGIPYFKDYWLFEKITEVINEVTNTYYKFKISDGVHLFSELPYQLLNGHSARISEDGYWEVFNDTTQAYIKTATKALGEDGKSSFEIWKEQEGNQDKTLKDFFDWIVPSIDSETKHWIIQGVDTNIVAEGKDGIISVDAPEDGKTYGRKNNQWVVVTTKNKFLDITPLFDSSSGPVSSVTAEYIEALQIAYDNNVSTGFMENGFMPISLAKDETTTSYMVFMVMQSTPEAMKYTIMPNKLVVNYSDLKVTSTISLHDFVRNGDGSKALMDNGTYKKTFDPCRLTTVTTLTDLPVTNYSIKATLSAASPISFVETPVEGEEYMIDILNSGSADFDQPLPNADNCQSNETSVTCPAGKVTAISVRYIHGKYVFRV